MLVELFIDGASDSLTRASSCFYPLEALMLKGCDLENVTQLSNYDQLTKLKRLAIHVGVWNDESLTAFISIINSCPQLEEFVLLLYWFCPPKRTRRNIREWTRRNIREVQRRSSPLKTSLKVFEFVGVIMVVCDDKLIMHVVANAAGLEKIVIDPVIQFSLTVSDTGLSQKRRLELLHCSSMKLSKDIYCHMFIYLSVSYGIGVTG